MNTSRRSFVKASATLAVAGMGYSTYANLNSSPSYEIKRQLRSKSIKTKEGWQLVEESVELQKSKTALIICDMWDLHHCKNAVDRVGELTPKIDAFTKFLRNNQSLIIHAPSSCMDFYQDHPARIRVGSIPKAANTPKDIGQWCDWMPGDDEKSHYPIDQSDGGCDSDPVEQIKFRNWLIKEGKNPGAPWTHQVPGIYIDGKKDYISDNGIEIWSILEKYSIDNVLLVGVHTNMCVLGRPFGLRQMSKNKKNVHLVRDLTDTMYNPQSHPYVSHFHGTKLIVEHIEKFVCPTTTSNEFLGGESFQFAGAAHHSD